MLKNWSIFFNEVKEKSYSSSLNKFLDYEYKNHTIYPPRNLMFNAFNLIDPLDVKVVIIGQDPYHNPNQAMGLSFSVPLGIKLPPSLINIYKEIENDLGVKMNYDSGDLTYLGKQGALLINAYLSVRENEPLSHHIKEYDLFMHDLVTYLESLNQPIVYMLWGNFAKQYKKMIVNPKHIVLESVHPSPLGANHGGWFGLHQFSRCNEFLAKNNVAPIIWKN
ncbi:MAG: uracil-DNA glycosylase [Bacilli bacterium]|nr:uracil-DNA glycosylase [Bacilli bacterium]